MRFQQCYLIFPSLFIYNYNIVRYRFDYSQKKSTKKGPKWSSFSLSLSFLLFLS